MQLNHLRWLQIGLEDVSAASHSRDDADGHTICHRGGKPFEVPNIIVINKNVHELAQVATLIEEPIGEPRVSAFKRRDDI
jgi:hypothetical protein